MQVSATRVQPEPAFNPLNVSIKLEDPRQARAFFALFNDTKIASFLRDNDFDPKAVRDAMKSADTDDFKIKGYSASFNEALVGAFES